MTRLKSVIFDGSFLNKIPSGIATDSSNFLKAFQSKCDQVQIVGVSNKILDVEFQLQHKNIFPSVSFRNKFMALTGLTLIPIDLKGSVYFSSQPNGLHPNYSDGVVLTRIHDIFPITNPEWFQPNVSRYFKFALEQSLLSDYLVCNSTATANSLLEYDDRLQKKIVVVPCETVLQVGNMCNSCYFCSLQEIPTTYLMTIGTFEPRKNLPKLIEAWINWKKSAAEHHKSKFIVVGTSKWLSKESLAALRKAVSHGLIFGGACNFQINRLLINASGYVSASINEGFNIPLHYAYDFGLPLLVSDIEAHQFAATNIIARFNPNSEEEIKAALVKWRDNFNAHGVKYRLEKHDPKKLNIEELVSLTVNALS